MDGIDTVPEFEGRISVSADDLTPLSELANRRLAGAVEAVGEGTIRADLSAFDGGWTRPRATSGSANPM